MSDKAYGAKLAELRKRAGITQIALAEALGVTDHTIRNWEKSREEPRLYLWQVKALCQLLQCSLDDLPDRIKPE
ncbi:XRE family transcriptional regulator [filamentous cyanobacterium CCP1]|nr:XRE family transcriptional regulator [filamentous cyanobacterium CCP1]